jgi:hypothetical protein
MLPISLASKTLRARIEISLRLFGRSLASKLSRLGALGCRLVSLGSGLETSHRQKT